MVDVVLLCFVVVKVVLFGYLLCGVVEILLVGVVIV